MKELDPPIAIEIRAEQQQRQKVLLKDRHLKKLGLTTWEYCVATEAIAPAKFEKVTLAVKPTPVHHAVLPVIVPENHRSEEGMKLIMQEGHLYVQALNKKNALRHFR